MLDTWIVTDNFLIHSTTLTNRNIVDFTMQRTKVMILSQSEAYPKLNYCNGISS